MTQIECWSNSRPYDSGCEQYHTGKKFSKVWNIDLIRFSFVGTSGRIQSYNFGQSSSSAYGHLPSQR